MAQVRHGTRRAIYVMPEGQVSQRASWRDPDGFVIRHNGRILRAVSAKMSAQYGEMIRAAWVVELMAKGDLPNTVEIPAPPINLPDIEGCLWLEHDVMAFPCYPHEITALQLFDSAKLTLRIATEAINFGWMLKDASAWNVLHSSGRPVFVDFLSFERAPPQGTWFAYGQFVRHFLLPLLLYRKLGITPAELFLVNRDGVTPEHAHRLLSRWDLLSPMAIELVMLPKFLARAGSKMIASRSSGASKPHMYPTELRKELFLNTFRHLGRMLERIRPDIGATKSTWKNYEEERKHYSDADLEAKKEFVASGLKDCATVLDLGCNAGEFSLLAAEMGRTVISADFDHPALSRLYARIRGHNIPISPVLVNLGRPTPAIGWQNREVAAFLERASGQCECILGLGLLHHLLVTERASLSMICNLLSDLKPNFLILEWIDPSDEKFREIAGLNAGLYESLDTEVFERIMMQKFRLITKMSLPCGSRMMYLWARSND